MTCRCRCGCTRLMLRREQLQGMNRCPACRSRATAACVRRQRTPDERQAEPLAARLQDGPDLNAHEIEARLRAGDAARRRSRWSAA